MAEKMGSQMVGSKAAWWVKKSVERTALNLVELMVGWSVLRRVAMKVVEMVERWVACLVAQWVVQ